MKIRLIPFLLLITNLSFGQIGKFHSSLEMGSNISGFTHKIGYYADSHSEYFHGSARMGFNTGIKLKYDLIKNTQIGVDLLYVNSGSRYVSNKNYSRYIRESTELVWWEPDRNRSVKSYILNYFEIPIYLNIIPKVEDMVEFSIFGGIGIFINMNSKLKHNYYYIEWLTPYEYLVEPQEDTDKVFFKPANRVNKSLFLGISQSVENFGFNLKVEWLFSDIYKEPTMITEHVIANSYSQLEIIQSNMKTGMWMVSLSFFLKILN